MVSPHDLNAAGRDDRPDWLTGPPADYIPEPESTGDQWTLFLKLAADTAAVIAIAALTAAVVAGAVLAAVLVLRGG